MNIVKRFTIQVYNIGIVSRKVLETGILEGDIKWLKHQYKDRFFADPFLWFRDEHCYYILAEEMCFFEGYGRIVLLKVSKNDFSLKSKKIIIEKPFHLSFPFCEENGDYIIPEAVGSNKCMRYKIAKDTLEILSEEMLVETGLIDPVLLDWNNEEWIFAGHKQNPSGELFIYQKEGSGRFQLISECPVLISRGGSRSAGHFFEYKGELMRPVQDCTERYGKRTRIMKVTRLDKHGYQDEEFVVLTSGANPPFNETLHTFNLYGDIALVDGSVDTFTLNNVYNKLRKLFRRIKSN